MRLIRLRLKFVQLRWAYNIYMWVGLVLGKTRYSLNRDIDRILTSAGLTDDQRLKLWREILK